MVTVKKILLVAFLFAETAAHAQIPGAVNVRMDSTMMKLNRMTAEDYAAIVLPPLDTLYYNAFTMSNAVNYYDAETEYYQRQVRTERRKPLDWIRIIGTYSYGNSDLSAISLIETTYQVWSQNSSSQRNMFYNVGVSVSIPLGDIFNTGNKARQAEAKVRQTQYRKASELDMIKKDIIEQYCTIIENLNLLESASQRMVTARAQYDVIESDFINGKSDAEVLYRSKSYVSAAVQDYERIRKELNNAILTLEVISCTPIISKQS